MLSVSLEGEEIQTKRDELRRYFQQSYDLFESLFELLAGDEVFYRQSEPTRHPMIFYFGHTAVFYINKLILSGSLKERINPRFEALFAVGVDEMSWDEESERFSWPSVDEVRHYRAQVRTVVEEAIRTLPMTLPITRNDPFWAIWMGIEHERIHIETSSVLHRQMPLRFIRPGGNFPICAESAAAPYNYLVPMEGGKILLGKGQSDRGLYGWDNEYGQFTETIEAFEASRYLVSNGEFLDFVEDGGYQHKEWWDEEGLKYLSIRQAVCPPFWVPQEDGTYRYRALAQETEMPLNWPVEVNALEAQAFCRWKSAKEKAVYRLPTEAEWYVMVRECAMDQEIFDDNRANINLAHYASSVPVDRFEQGKLCDVIGNVWQWTQSPIDGYEGFAPHPWYDDFSTPTFDTKHNVIKGGSWISTGNEIVSYSRYAFRRHFIQHAGFRYIRARTLSENREERVIEERDIALLCEDGYGSESTFARKAMEAMTPFFRHKGAALELGCGAGRLSLELSALFGEVTGIDISARFIAPGVELLKEGTIRYRLGDTISEVRVEWLNLPHARDRVRFYQGDKANLKPHLNGYDCIIINAADEGAEDSEASVHLLGERLNREGVLIVLSSQPLREDSGRFEYVRRGESRNAYVTVWDFTR